MNTKKCTKCNNEYEASTCYFYKKETGKYGLRSICKTCYLEDQRIKKRLRFILANVQNIASDIGKLNSGIYSKSSERFIARRIQSDLKIIKEKGLDLNYDSSKLRAVELSEKYKITLIDAITICEGKKQLKSNALLQRISSLKKKQSFEDFLNEIQPNTTI